MRIVAESRISTSDDVFVQLQSTRRDAIAEAMWQEYQEYLNGYGDIGV
jgi:hypothetical protein